MCDGYNDCCNPNDGYFLCLFSCYESCQESGCCDCCRKSQNTHCEHENMINLDLIPINKQINMI